jgi:glycosyltransferase involved in cell wall biosynthesis
VKILFAGASGDRYGADAVVRSIAAHMSASDSDAVLVLPEEGPGREAAEKQGLRVEIVHTPVLRKADLSFSGLFRVVTSAVPSLLSHIRILRKERPDLVWVNTITIPLWILAARVLGIRVACHTHEIVGSSVWLRRCLYAPLFLTGRVIAVSQACRKDIVAAYPSLDRRIAVAINPSFGIEKRVPVRPGAENDIVLIGRVSARKGHDVLLEAIGDPELAVLNPVVHICGEPYRSPAAQEFAAHLRARAAAVGSEVRFHGYVPTEEALTLGAIVVIPSSEPESCPLVVAEAMTAGRAVVATVCGGIPEIAGGAAYLVPVRRPDLLAAALARLISDPDERRRQEAASLTRAKMLSSQTYLAAMQRLAGELVGGGAGPDERPASGVR